MNSDILSCRSDHWATRADDTKQGQNFAKNISVNHSQVGVWPSWPMLLDATTWIYDFMDNR